jgi:hypothetical protein
MKERGVKREMCEERADDAVWAILIIESYSFVFPV